MNDNFSPVDPDFEDEVLIFKASGKSGKVHYFDSKGQVEDSKGSVQSYLKETTDVFILVNNHKIRIDRIITLFGRPGPAYDQYNSYADACLNCYDPFDATP